MRRQTGRWGSVLVISLAIFCRIRFAPGNRTKETSYQCSTLMNPATCIRAVQLTTSNVIVFVSHTPSLVRRQLRKPANIAHEQRINMWDALTTSLVYLIHCVSFAISNEILDRNKNVSQLHINNLVSNDTIYGSSYNSTMIPTSGLTRSRLVFQSTIPSSSLWRVEIGSWEITF